MLQNVSVSNPNDLKVVSFHNNTDFGFTPEMGCMFDGRPVNGVTGKSGIEAGESITLPYHVAHRLATNLAKVVLVKNAPSDPTGIPTGVPLWGVERLEELKNSYLTELYSESKPTALSETDRLMAKVEELKKFVEDNVPSKVDVTEPSDTTSAPKVFQDKQEVILELEKRAIPHDKRKNKQELEKLLA